MVLAAAEFDPEAGLSGGVRTVGINSSRDTFAEAGVRREVSLQADAEQDATQLSWVEGAVDLNDAAGIASSMDRLFKSFQSWSIAPSSHSEKENVLAAAGGLAVAFNRTADSLNRISGEAEEQIKETVEAVNTLADRIRAFNEDRRTGRQSDAGVEARIYNALEELSELVNVQAIWHEVEP
jgi:flagellar hook-associated protein FlgK